MSIHQKLAERLASTGDNWGFTASFSIHRGDFDDILGVPEPTLEDVQREAVRVLGVSSGVDVCQGRVEIHAHPSIQIYVNLGGREWPKAIAAVYVALRTLPDYEANP